MNNDNTNEVIDTIKSRGTKMRPRWHFIIRAVLAIIAAIALFLLILFVVGFVIFVLQENGGFFATGFGPAGWFIFLHSLPWTFLLLSLILILILWLLLRRYTVVSHQPFIYVLLFLIIVLALTFFFLSAAAIHGGIFRYASRNQIPLVSGLYAFETAPMSGVYRGQVIILATSSFILGNPLGQTSTVIMIPAALSELNVVNPGDYLIIFGRGISSATIEGYGLERVVDYQ